MSKLEEEEEEESTLLAVLHFAPYLQTHDGKQPQRHLFCHIYPRLSLSSYCSYFPTAFI
jgi:hypothetical protein